MSPGSDIPVALTRTGKPDLVMTVTAGDTKTTSEVMNLAPWPTTHLIQENRYSKPFRSTCSDCIDPSPRSGTLTIELPSDEVVVPRSESILYTSDGSSPDVSPRVPPNKSTSLYGSLNPDQYSLRYQAGKVEVPVSVGEAVNGTTWCGAWVLAVKVFVPVPIGVESSGREKPQPDIGNCWHPKLGPIASWARARSETTR